jgi:predicted flap endonuclease-1-like 5' DNA nuclease
MPYTLTMGWLWFAAAFLLGLLTGVLLRSVSRRQRPRPAASPPPAADGGAGVHVADTRLERALEAVTAERDALRTELDAIRRAGDGTTRVDVDVAGAAAVLGHPITADDLTVVEGIDADVATLCRWMGVHTWGDLATTPVSLLRTMLADAGPAYAAVDPGSWPDQARLLAEARWQEFADLAAVARGDRDGGRG